MPRKSAESAGILSKSALARELSISRERVGVYCERGMPTLPDGRLNRMAALAWVAANVNANASNARAQVPRGVLPPDGDARSGPSYTDARRLLEIVRVQEGRLRLEKARGEVITKALMQETVFGLARTEREAWTNWPGRVAAILAAELGCDALALHAALEREVRNHLSELAPIGPEPVGEKVDASAVG
jgi:hypothetical protein